MHLVLIKVDLKKKFFLLNRYVSSSIIQCIIYSKNKFIKKKDISTLVIRLERAQIGSMNDEEQ